MRIGGIEGYAALQSTGNGNCLINSVSIVLLGDESNAVELKKILLLILSLADLCITFWVLLTTKRKLDLSPLGISAMVSSIYFFSTI